MTDRYKDYNMYLCKHGHIRYAREFHDPDMCNFCGTTEFTPIPEDEREETLKKIKRNVAVAQFGRARD